MDRIAPAIHVSVLLFHGLLNRTPLLWSNLRWLRSAICDRCNPGVNERTKGRDGRKRMPQELRKGIATDIWVVLNENRAVTLPSTVGEIDPSVS